MAFGNSLFPVVFIAIALVAVAVFVVAIVSVVRNSRRVRQHGLDPMTLQADLAAKVMRSDLLSGGQSKAQRLAELDAMLTEGVITPAEHAAARAAILRS
ncbi:uncharacterized protein HemY [Conyzicola nivalis]|uniref:Uncharacterized protein HemY n=1 Tax=Conyzicola nivalis TaxID=1477021 RepID=A0ABV2QK19_9MICO